MDKFFIYDPITAGSKGLVFIGDDLLVYRRDNNTKLFPLYIDLPGGGPNSGETPFETFQREVKEEFNLRINREDVVFVQTYPSTLEEGKLAYFPVAKLPKEAAKNIVFGDEGLEYMLMPLQEFITRADVWPMLQERAAEYAKKLTL